MNKKYKELLGLARKAILAELENKKLNIDEKIKKKFSEKKACFVTLTISSELRGCIGSLYARQELWKDVAENAKNAAFSDPRFNSLTLDELEKIKIERI
jgi:AmmeMemoRadiSam system protein A